MLKRLELIGFKSFSQKTVLDFPKGITVIVGPNGSGKSNIIDAIKWILGERESRQLRSHKAEDLIFSGTSERTRLGLAQASVYFDNNQQIFPLEYSDIVITRKIARDGSAECLINKSEARLKDIINLFASSRLGTRGLTIINQGNSDLFVKASPKDRREMMEEVLGLRQHQIKKHEAELKLKNTRDNLAQSKTIVEELLPHLKLLRRQVSKWKQSATLFAELKDLENQYFSFRIQQLKSSDTGFEEKTEETDRHIQELLQAIKNLENELAQIESQKPNRDHQLDQEKILLQKTLGKLETKLEFIKDANDQPAKLHTHTREELLNLIHNLRSMIAENKPIEELAKAIDFFFVKQPTVIKQEQPPEEQIYTEIREVKARLEKIDLQENDRIQTAASFNERFKNLYATLAAHRHQLHQLESQRNQFLLEKDRWLWRWQELERQITQANRQTHEFNLALASDFDHLASERKILKLRQDLAMIGQPDSSVMEEAKNTEERYQFMTKQMGDLETAVGDLNNLIKNLEDKIHSQFADYLNNVNEELGKNFKAMFGEGKAKLVLSEPSLGEEEDNNKGILIYINLPRKGVKSLEALSGGEKSLVSLAVLFSLIAVTPPPFLVLDEVDAALDEANSRRFAQLVKNFADKTQFVIVTHNRSVMEAADMLYGVTMGSDGISKILSLRLDK